MKPEVPGDLYGRRRQDRLMRAMATMVEALDRVAGLDTGRPPVTSVDRDLHVVVERVRTETPDVRSVTFVPDEGTTLPPWQPGSHVDVQLPSGRVRQYSLCGDPADRDRYRIAVRRIGVASQEVHEELHLGRRMTLRGPRNAFPLVRAERYLFIAGGIGVTPILPMLRAVSAGGADWRFIYCGRSRESMPLLEELATFDPARTWIRPDDEYGVPVSGSELLAGAEGATVYCCGPAALTTGLRMDLPASGARELHSERFSPPPITAGEPFEVQLGAGGRVLTVAADESALDAVRRVRPDVAYSCRQGFCGTCRVGLLAGEADHRDHVLAGDERACSFLPCVSRAERDRLVLDL
ncbi:PDR/VanB family oxidoreductase [Parasphingorhabdus pacifica]